MDSLKSVPRHVAFIMDGNRRWARANKIELLLGHDRGAHQIEPLVEFAANKGISYLTFWAFSTENWQRGEKEVSFLMDVFRRMLKGPMIGRMKKNGVRLGTIGDISKFPKDIQESIENLVEETKQNTKIRVTIALNYGGRDEILQAVKKIITNYPPPLMGEDEGNINETLFSQYLYTSGIPDPDLLIRTGGEKRLSGFLPWQTVYAELYFTDTLWPDFDGKEFQKALDEYASRERRFGK